MRKLNQSTLTGTPSRTTKRGGTTREQRIQRASEQDVQREQRTSTNQTQRVPDIKS